jgi:hypothetical protein
VLTASGIFRFRVVGGTLAVLGGLIVVEACENDQSLGVAGLLLGVFILGHLTIEGALKRSRERFALRLDADRKPRPDTENDLQSGGNVDLTGAENEPQPTGGLREFASAFVSTSGVILGLLAVFGERSFSLTIKVAVGALVADILVGIVLVGLLLSAPDPEDQRSWNLIRYVFNVALWALALGLLCIGAALLYR